jgi:hypothetical protein
MALIFEKTAKEALMRSYAQPVAASTGHQLERGSAETIVRTFSTDTFKSGVTALKSVPDTKNAIKRLVGNTLGPTDLAAATEAATVEVEEKFGKDGMRTNLDEAIAAWSAAHPKAPTAKQIDAFVAGSGNAKVADFVTPIVTYRPRNPTLVPNAAEAEKLRAQIHSNFRATSTAMRALNNSDREAFRKVYDSMSSRPDGQLALVRLLWDGKLSMGGAGRPNRNLIEALGDLAQNEKLDSGILHRRTAFLAQLTQELADPVAVSQHYKGTCAATSRGQILWSLQNPTDYTDFVHDLARPEGKAKLPNGQSVRRPADWDAGNDKSPNDLGLPGAPTGEGRTISSQLTEPVFMQVGYGKQYRYSNTFDAGYSFTQPNKQVMDGGLYGEQEARLLEALFPGKKITVIYHTKADLKDSFASVSKSQWPGNRVVVAKPDTVSVLKGASIDHPIAVGVNYELDGGHAILVTSVHTVSIPANPKIKGSKAIEAEFVDYINPWGQRETQRLDAFLTVMDGITTDGSTLGVMGH